jgi:hypothetical protein
VPSPMPRASANVTSVSSLTTSCSSLLLARGFQQSTRRSKDSCRSSLPGPRPLAADRCLFSRDCASSPRVPHRPGERPRQNSLDHRRGTRA